MAVPTFAAAGTGHSATIGSANNIAYPSGIVEGDILILHFFAFAKSAPSTPAGFTAITNVAGHYAWWRLADGTESGTVSITHGDSAGRYARMYRFSGAAASVDNVVTANGVATTTVDDAGVTTSSGNRLAVQLLAVWDNQSVGDFTGESGGDWVEATPEFATTSGNDGCLQVQTADMPTVGTINGGSLTMAGAADWAIIGFSLVATTSYPVGLATETDSALSITPVLIPIGVHANINVAEETDSALSITPVKTAAADIYIYSAIDFGSGYEQLESLLLSGSIHRGRPGDNLGRVEAGTAEQTYHDRLGVMDPSNTTSPYYGKIVPLANLRILRRHGGVTYERFTGPVERWQPDWDLPTAQRMSVEAADSFEPLANFLIESDHATMTTALSGADNDLVFTARDGGGDGDNITVEYVVAGLSTPLSGETTDPFGGASVIATGEGSDPFGSITGGAFGGSSAVQTSVTVSGSDIVVNVATNGAGAPTSTAAQIKAALELIPEVMTLVAIEHAPGSSGAGVVTAMIKTNLSGGKWPEEYSGARINRILDLAGWDLTLRDIDAGNYIIAPKGYSLKEGVSALAAMQDTADSELGYIFMRGDNTVVYHGGAHRSTEAESTISQATFSNVDGSGFVAESLSLTLDKDAIVNDAVVTGGRDGAEPQHAEDLYSQTGLGTPPPGAPYVYPPGYGKRSLSRTTLLANDEDCLAQAESIVTAYAYPLPRLAEIETFEPKNAESSAWVTGVLALDIGYRITVNVRPPGAVELPTTAYVMFIEEITDTWAESEPMRVRFGLTSAAQSVAIPPPPPAEGALLNNIGGPLILDDATNGKIGA